MGKLIVALYGYGECPSKREKKGKEEGKGGKRRKRDEKNYMHLHKST